MIFLVLLVLVLIITVFAIRSVEHIEGCTCFCRQGRDACKCENK